VSPDAQKLIFALTVFGSTNEEITKTMMRDTKIGFEFIIDESFLRTSTIIKFCCVLYRNGKKRLLK